MKLTRADMLTHLQATGFGNTTGEVIRQKNWLDTAYMQVWNARDPGGAPIAWSFAKVDQTALTVTAGLASPTMPADFGSVDWIEDDLGSTLKEMDPATFDLTFAPAVAQGQTAVRPWAFKVVNRQVVFGPTPSGSGTFKWSYTRRLSHYDTGGNVVSGTFTTDTDYPLWPDHHLIVVYEAALLGHSENSNPFGLAFQGMAARALDAMRADLEAEFAPSQVWGDGGWAMYGGYGG